MTTPPARKSATRRVVSRAIFFSRWLQLPLYIGLIAAQGIYVWQFWVELSHLLSAAFGDLHAVQTVTCSVQAVATDCSKLPEVTTLSEATVMLVVLGLVDVVMISNLLIMVIIGGYETFVSRLDLDDHPDQPEWLSHVNASVLKVKLGTAIIGISSIHLLKTFINASQYDAKTLIGQTGIHLAFLLSAIAIGYAERIVYRDHGEASGIGREPVKFLFAWELGGGLGHTQPLAQIARPLLEGGHEVDFVLRDLSSAKTALGDLHDHPRTRLWQAPVWHPQFRSVRHPVSYTELLFVAGYLDAPRLIALAKAWRSLLDSIAPDLLLADYAPTALLAARGHAFPRVVMGNGYLVPPDRVPLPAFAEWEQADPVRLAATERTVLDACNVVLRALDLPPMRALRELHVADERFLFTWPELDQYSAAVRGPDTRYDGVLAPRSGGAPPRWPDGDGRRLFAYLRFESPQTAAVLRRLALGPWRTFAYVSGIPAREAAAIASPFLDIAPTPADLDAVGRSADALLCHGNFNTVCQLLCAGVPVIVLPTDAEKLLAGRRVEKMGAGFVLAGDRVADDLPKALERLATESSFRDTARAFAARRGQRDEDVAAWAAGRCEALAAASIAARLEARTAARPDPA